MSLQDGLRLEDALTFIACEWSGVRFHVNVSDVLVSGRSRLERHVALVTRKRSIVEVGHAVGVEVLCVSELPVALGTWEIP